MKIAVDIRCLSGSVYYQGISQYTKNVLTNMIKNSKHDFLLFPGFNFKRKNSIKKLFTKNNDRIRLVWSPIPMRIIETLWKFNWPSIESLLGKVDIFFSPNFFLPPVKQINTVVTIHDLSFLHNPEWFPKNEAKMRENNLIKTFKKTNAIIAVSKFTANELKKYYPEVSNKVHIIYEATSLEFKFRDTSETESLKSRLNLDDEFILYVGALDTRKNLTSLIKGFIKLKKAGRTKSQLVLAGLAGYKANEIMKAAEKGVAQNWIRFPGYISQEDLPVLYSAAKIFCYLSTYEGFGLPPLEALSCGAKVLVSNLPVFKEILGENAHYVDPVSISEIADGIEICENASDAKKSRRIQWASKYTWDKTSKRHLEVFEKVYENCN